MSERRAIIFSGKVQGVGFRATTRSVMRGFAVSGWVRNEPDGTVRAEVQGEAGEIDAALARLRERMGGYIRGEQAYPMGVEAGEEGFEIRR
ncbi:MAG: acylphosphatase [Phycisphaerales bacterium]|jgi:acylphosphatase